MFLQHRVSLWGFALALLCLSIPFLAATTAFAQFSFPVTGSDLRIFISPEYPAPGGTVRVSVQSLLTDLEASNIAWFVNSMPVAQGLGLKETSVVMGPLGSEARVRVEVGAGSATAVLRPTVVDLLWEGDSYVPPFYRGRALPTAGGGIRLFAIPRLQYTGAETPVSPDELIYTWRKNNKLIQTANGRGKHTAFLESPLLFSSDTFSVEVRTADNELRGFSSVRIASVEPSLVLYENHPLFGILYHRALGKQAITPEVEIALSAVPYFAPVRNPDDGSLVYQWRVNRTEIQSSPTRPSTITLNAEGATGQAFIELALTHATNFFLSVSKAWNITLANTGGSGASDPFRQQ